MKGYPEWQVPPFIEQICLHIEEVLVDHEGIFRVSGSLQEIQKIQKTLSDGGNVDFWQIEDSMAICDLLKTFLRDLPEPLLTYELAPKFLEKSQEESFDGIRELINKLPNFNKQLLKRICICMNKVAKHSEKNKMNISNLSKVLGPNIVILSQESDPLKELETMEQINNLTEKLIVNLKQVFSDVDYKPYYLSYVKAFRDYYPEFIYDDTELNDELQVEEGELILMTYKHNESGWYVGECHGKTGFIPASHLQYLNGTLCVPMMEEMISKAGGKEFETRKDFENALAEMMDEKYASSLLADSDFVNEFNRIKMARRASFTRKSEGDPTELFEAMKRSPRSEEDGV
eukprot:CAMPEP_0174263336 /NCGR_PEP_ID=MMETSP0439-20130205/18224_1 /TAXON_ID=0 /ORGANISM="Stereomyxa ramosa, Strain Chinc5" /LENGTH=344 /DNA_ID=CAMNT_0015348637 /DNA_START=499 /DNA_END=1533 /DNA_ORIENTATION=+